MKGQTTLEMPKEKKSIRLLVMIDQEDKILLERGMRMVGEKNQSNYIRRLIFENGKGK
jgi:hypothetical protein